MTHHKQITLLRIHFHGIVLESDYSDIEILSAKLQSLQPGKKNKSFK